MLKMTQDEIIALYQQGGFIGQSAPFGDWWRYLPDHRPGLARMIESSTPQAMESQGLLYYAWADGLAKVKVYELAARLDELDEDAKHV